MLSCNNTEIQNYLVTLGKRGENVSKKTGAKWEPVSIRMMTEFEETEKEC